MPTRFDPDLIAKLDPRLHDDLSRQGFQVTGYRLELVGYQNRPVAVTETREPREPDHAAGSMPGRRPIRRRKARPSHEPGSATTVSRLSTRTRIWTDRRLRADLEGVLNRAVAAGVVQIIAIGTTAATSAASVELAADLPRSLRGRRHPPQRCGRSRTNETGRSSPTCRTPRRRRRGRDRIGPLLGPHAVPECSKSGSTAIFAWPTSETFPSSSIAATARATSSSNCNDSSVPIRGVMHAFTGTWDDAQACLELGLHLSFAGMVTFTNKSLDPLRDVAARVPLDRLLVETDSPYLSPHPCRGQTNEPARVALTAARLAEIRGLSLADFARITTTNARRLFRLPDDVITLNGHAHMPN